MGGHRSVYSRDKVLCQPLGDKLADKEGSGPREQRDRRQNDSKALVNSPAEGFGFKTIM